MAKYKRQGIIMEEFLTTLVVIWSSFMAIGVVIVSTYIMWDILRNIFKGEL
jgi:hypothetical protein